MNRKFLLFSLVLLLTGCAQPVWKTEIWKDHFRNAFSSFFPDREVQADHFAWAWENGPEAVLTRVTAGDPARPQFKASRVHARLSWRSLFHGQIFADHWIFEDAEVLLSRSGEGDWNWSIPGTAFSGIDKIQFLNARAYFEDASRNPPFTFSLEISQASFKKPDTISPWQANIFFRAFRDSRMPLHLGFSYDPGQTRAEFSLNSADGRVEVSGNVLEPAGAFRVYFKAGVHQEDLGFLVSQTEGMHGVLTADFEGGFEGTHPSMIKRSLSLQGALDIRRGSFTARNVLSEVLASLRPTVSFQSGTGRDFKGLLGVSEGTPFDLLQLSGRVMQEQFFADNFRAKHPSYFIEGEGKAGLEDGLLDLRARLICMEDLSAWLKSQDRSFEPFLNETGRMVVPFLYRGLLPDIAPEADWETISMIQNTRKTASAEGSK